MGATQLSLDPRDRIFEFTMIKHKHEQNIVVNLSFHSPTAHSKIVERQPSRPSIEARILTAAG